MLSYSLLLFILFNVIIAFNPLDSSFINLFCAEEPILLTLKPLLIEGLIPNLKRIGSNYICPSVILITLVLIYSLISLLRVSIIGKEVILPPPYNNLSFPLLSNKSA